MLTGCNTNESNVTKEGYVIENIVEYDNSEVEGVLAKILVNKNGVIYGFEV